jgi:hypothetical protein
VILTVVLAGACASEDGGGAQQPVRECTREGRTTVPPMDYGTNAGKAVRILEEAGLVAHKPDVDWPYYVTGTVPEAGSPVSFCDVIELIPGDG